MAPYNYQLLDIKVTKIRTGPKQYIFRVTVVDQAFSGTFFRKQKFDSKNGMIFTAIFIPMTIY